MDLALPQITTSYDKPQSMVNDMVSHFGLMQGIDIIAQQHGDSLRQGFNIRDAPFEPSQTGDLEVGLQSAITRLNDLNEARDNSVLDQTRAARLQIITYHVACRKAILHLEDLFARCENP